MRYYALIADVSARTQEVVVIQSMLKRHRETHLQDAQHRATATTPHNFSHCCPRQFPKCFSAKRRVFATYQ